MLIFFREIADTLIVDTLEVDKSELVEKDVVKRIDVALCVESVANTSVKQ